MLNEGRKLIEKKTNNSALKGRKTKRWAESPSNEKKQRISPERA
jgi:hypothetical protein